MMNFKALLAGVAMSFGLMGSVQATPLAASDGWVQFAFGRASSLWDTTFTFSGPGVLKVTDAFLSGDQFEVYDNGVLLGGTSAPGTSGLQIGGDFDGAFNSSDWSHGQFVFGDGDHSITGVATLSPFDGGAGAVQLIAGVASAPEPSTWALMLVGTGLAGLGLRRRKAALAAA